MRARQRHFNPRDVGASQSYDARFINLANMTSIANWSNRVSPGTGDANQSTVGLRPTLSERGINGQSAINFPGSRYLFMPASPSSDIEIYVLGSHAYKPWGGNYSVDLQVYIDQSHNSSSGFVLQTRPDLSSTRITFAIIPPSTDPVVDVNANTFNLFVASRIRAGNTITYVNGVSRSIISGSQNWVSNNTQAIGAWWNGGNVARFLNGNIGCVSVFTKTLTDSVRRRIERGTALSFKIACS